MKKKLFGSGTAKTCITAGGHRLVPFSYVDEVYPSKTHTAHICEMCGRAFFLGMDQREGRVVVRELPVEEFPLPDND